MPPSLSSTALPLVEKMARKEEVFWANPDILPFARAAGSIPLTPEDTADAEGRLGRWAPYLASVFEDTAVDGGRIESPLKAVPELQASLSRFFGRPLEGRLMLKLDSHLPVSGSIKARGGIYEVLKHAEDLALAHRLVSRTDDYTCFNSPEFKRFFSRYAIAVGSTGNLGLSIGIMGAALGFKVFVHMSADAKAWKKALLREKGVTVIEAASDYSLAVAEGRKQAQADPATYFVDDENSRDLFLGYATAGARLASQLDAAGIRVDGAHPLFVYLPCGVGGSPGGITLGLKQVFGDHVHCFFAEPVASPCVLLGMMTGRHEKISVRDIGLDNLTHADGLACARSSGFVGRVMENVLSGIFTVQDKTLYQMLALTADREDLFLEPSALAGMPGPWRMAATPDGQTYTDIFFSGASMASATHIVWATGGSMVPAVEMAGYVAEGRRLLSGSGSRFCEPGRSLS